MVKRRGRPSSGVETALVRVPKDLARKLRVITTLRNTTNAELLEPVLRPFVEKEHAKVIREAADR